MTSMANRVSSRDKYNKPSYSTEELRLKAETYCARAEHCADEVQRKILDWGGDTATAEAVIDALYANHYLDDERYCRAYVHDKLLFRHWGKVKIRMMLQAHGLPKECIASAIENIDESEYNCILREVMKQKKNVSREQQIRFLLQRGFEYRDILAALDE